MGRGGVGEHASGAGSSAGGGVEQHGLLDAGQGGQQLTNAHVQSGARGVAAHQVSDGQGEHAVEDVHPDFLVGPVEHRGEADHLGVFELAESLLGVVLGAVGGHDLGDGPALAVGDEQAFTEQLGLQLRAGGWWSAPG